MRLPLRKRRSGRHAKFPGANVGGLCQSSCRGDIGSEGINELSSFLQPFTSLTIVLFFRRLQVFGQLTTSLDGLERLSVLSRILSENPDVLDVLSLHLCMSELVADGLGLVDDFDVSSTGKCITGSNNLSMRANPFSLAIFRRTSNGLDPIGVDHPLPPGVRLPIRGTYGFGGYYPSC